MTQVVIYMEAYIDQNLQHHDVLLSNAPDAGYEYFWLNFKSSVSNTTSKYVHELVNVSNNLNWCKSHLDYDKIPGIIQQFLKGFFWDLLHISPLSDYHIRIAYSNLKRWIKLCHLRRAYPMENVTPYDPLEDPDMKYLHLCYRMYMDIGTDLKPDKLPENIDTGKEYLLDLAFNHRRAGIFSKLLEHYPEWTINAVMLRSGVSLPVGIKNGSKVLRLLSL